MIEMSAPEWRGIVVKKYRALLDGVEPVPAHTGSARRRRDRQDARRPRHMEGVGSGDTVVRTAGDGVQKA